MSVIPFVQKKPSVSALRDWANKAVNGGGGKPPLVNDKSMDIAGIARSMDLAKPLKESFLKSLNLEQLQILKKILVERGAHIFGEIGELCSTDLHARGQFARRMFNAEERDGDGKIVFRYSCEPRFADSNFFVPGEWFAPKVKELQELRRQREHCSETFAERSKSKLIAELLGK